jgi:hypothetical protein
VVAVRNGLVYHATDDETPLEMFPKVVVETSELRGPSKKEHVAATDVTWADAPPKSLDTEPFVVAARAGGAPDRAALVAKLAP